MPDVNKKVYKLNFGPQQPSTNGIFRLLVLLRSEYIISVDKNAGLLQRGTQKLAESKNYSQALPYLDRLDYARVMCKENINSLWKKYCVVKRSVSRRLEHEKIITVKNIKS